MYVSFKTMSRGVFMCDVWCTTQICYSWDSLGIEGAGVRKCLSLSERGGTSGWVAPYFSPGSAWVIQDRVVSTTT